MAKKRSKSVQQSVDSLNNVLALESIMIGNNDDNTIASYPVSSNEAQRFLEGICSAIEVFLHRSDTYKGYRYLYLGGPEDVRKKFCREYY